MTSFQRTFGAALVSSLILSACTTPGQKTGIGAGVGAGVGAAAGAIIGHQSGKRGQGALIGAGVGALLGGGAGNYLDRQAKELATVAETKRTDHGIITKLKGDILFDSGLAVMKPEADEQIGKLGAIIKKYPEDKLVIVGHTDSQGKAETNKALSEQRAQAVMLQLLRSGVPKESMTVVGMGAGQPVADNKTAAGRAQNRRVEIQITVDERKLAGEGK